MAAENQTSPPTLREIARQAGVSHTTVSLSLRNHPSIPKATRERICKIADEMGYRSNVLVSALMTQVRERHQKSVPEVVGFLTGGDTPDEWRNHSAMAGFYAGAREQAPKLGMRVEAFWLGPGGARAVSTCRILRARAIRGTLIAPFPKPIYEYELNWDQLSCVGLGYVYNDRSLHRATHNHFQGVNLAYRNLVRLGYKRIGLMLRRQENRRVNYGWLGGFLAAQSTLEGAPIPPLLRGPADPLSDLESWIEQHHPDAVIGFGPEQYHRLRKIGANIPHDLAFASLDVEQMHIAQLEDAAGINQNLPRIGATAIDKLATLLYHNEQGLSRDPVLSMIEGTWTDGGTAPMKA